MSCRVLLLPALFSWATAATADTIALRGVVGVTQNWALNVTLHSDKDSDRVQYWSGTMLLRHIGSCSAEGKELKTGTASALSDRKRVYQLVISFENDRCVFPGPIELGQDAAPAFMRCHDGFEVPTSLWQDP